MIRSRTISILSMLAIVLSIGGCTNAWAADDDALALGKKVFTELAEPQCMICHTLEDAGAEGKIGPVLDELKPTKQRVRMAVTGGVGAMPSFEEILTKEQIDAVAAYVANVTGATAK